MKIPHGLLCCVCTKASCDCSTINFEQMKVAIVKHKDGVVEVKCTEYQKR